MIYIFHGLSQVRGELIKIDLSDFDYIAQVKPKQLEGDFKPSNEWGTKPIPDKLKANQPYFLSGKSIGRKKTDESVVYKGLLVLDIERDKHSTELLEEETIKKRVKDSLGNYRYILYPTINNQPHYARYRLILEPERTMNKEESIQTTLEIMAILEAVNIPVDSASKDYARVQGLPIDNGLSDYEITVNEGDKYPVMVQDRCSNEKGSQENFKNERDLKSEKRTYTDEEVAYYMNEYVDRYMKELTEYSKAQALIMQLIKSYQDGIISYDGAIEALTIMAMGDGDWIEGNIRKFEAEKELIPRTKYDFNVIAGIIDGVFEDFREFFEIVTPQSMKEVFQQLKKEGESWRVKNSNEAKSVPIMHESHAVYLLKRVIPFCLVGDDYDSATLAFYNPDKGIYETSETLMNRLIKTLEYRYLPNRWKNVLNIMRTEVKLKKQTESRYLIPVANGVYHTRKKELMPFSPEYVFLSKIKTAYNPEAIKPIINEFDFDAWLQSIACHDDEVVTLLWQVINEAINPNYTRKKIGFLIGDGNSGKGTFQRLLENLIGRENIATLKPPQFADRFSKGLLIGKVCNIGDDISNAYIDDVSDLMSIATGDTIAIEQKMKSVVTINLSIFCLFSGNDMPNVRNKSKGWYRRALIIPFNADFNGAKNDPRIKEEYLADPNILEFVLKTALELDFNYFIEPKVVKDILNDYKLENDYIRAFVAEVFINDNLNDYKQLPVNFIKDKLIE